MRIIMLLAFTALLISACSQEDSGSASEASLDAQADVAEDINEVADLVVTDLASSLDAPILADTGSESCPAPSAEVVSFETDDGVLLEADLHTTGVAGSPAVVLLHMIPPGNDRSNYPVAFREQLNEAGFTVLNVDRRGAGGSQGVASEAYDGPNGKLDAAAAVTALAALDCAPDLSRLAIIGASNGTTTALDYAVYASGESDTPDPSALVFLTGGNYTENQHTLSDVLDAVASTPILFVFPADESAWSQGYAGASPSWKHSEYEPSGHGTHLFDSAPESMTDVTQWLSSTL